MPSRIVAVGIAVLLAFTARAGAQTWTPLAHQPIFSASTALLLTDGTVMMQDTGGTAWWQLRPDNLSSYVNGSWSRLASSRGGLANGTVTSGLMTLVRPGRRTELTLSAAPR